MQNSSNNHQPSQSDLPPPHCLCLGPPLTHPPTPVTHRRHVRPQSHVLNHRLGRKRKVGQRVQLGAQRAEQQACLRTHLCTPQPPPPLTKHARTRMSSSRAPHDARWLSICERGHGACHAQPMTFAAACWDVQRCSDPSRANATMQGRLMAVLMCRVLLRACVATQPVATAGQRGRHPVHLRYVRRGHRHNLSMQCLPPVLNVPTFSSLSSEVPPTAVALTKSSAYSSPRP